MSKEWQRDSILEPGATAPAPPMEDPFMNYVNYVQRPAPVFNSRSTDTGPSVSKRAVNFRGDLDFSQGNESRVFCAEKRGNTNRDHDQESGALPTAEDENSSRTSPLVPNRLNDDTSEFLFLKVGSTYL